MVDIVGLGEVVVDWVAQIDHFPEPDEKVNSTKQDLFAGGVTANYTTAVSRLGGSAGFIGAVGDDDHGTFLMADFRKEKVDISALSRVPGTKTPVNFIFVVSSTGEKTIIQSPYMLTTRPLIDDAVLDYISASKLLHITGIHAQETQVAVGRAQERQIKVTCDLEGQIALRGWKTLEPILRNVDVIMPNKSGALALSGKDSILDAARFFLAKGIDLVVLTLGKEGSLIITKDQKLKIPSFEVQVIDTTGAGDTFTAAFDWAVLIKGWDLERAGLFANAAAALKCTKLGARTGMPTFAQTIAFLEKRGKSV